VELNSTDKKVLYHLKDFEDLLDGKFVFPITCEIDPSNRCMLSCSFCLFKDRLKDCQVDLDWDIYCNLIQELKQGGTKSITFTGGGEPLLNPRFNDMVKLACDMGFQIGLITNGVLLDRVNCLDSFYFIRISLDAATAETYKKIKGKPMFYEVLANVDRAVIRTKGSDKTVIGLSFVVCEQNKKEVEKMPQLAKDFGVNYLQIKPAWIDGDIFNGYEDVLGQENVILMRRQKARDHSSCQIAGYVGIVNADGSVYFCCQHRGNPYFQLGFLQDAPFLDLWKKRKNLQPDITKCPMCRYTNYLHAYRRVMGTEEFSFFEHKNFL